MAPLTERAGGQETVGCLPQATTLRDVGLVPWGDIEDSTGSAAAIPYLLAAIASGDEAAARDALDRLRYRICRHGFVVGQATAVTVPFLWDLVRRPQTTCRAQILRLLRNIADARQWETTAAAYPKLRRHGHHVEWESAARRAVRSGRGVIPGLLTEPDVELVDATKALASTLTD
ncbi:hypothetical protein SAMN06272735_7851 [Streptomyces sp. TLI_55]|uniref:hypothetical protein n=1 Tax=Streptomyces sp. TLI_55 TaxID=1938861 RepID=UPI000BC85B6E|nr:hypothetical protein [Streptomyces sp. TLI_55]SNX66008.1 hypothetical protein SAMN06272735_7851 [Streptomyces sp. TLI_55]